MNAIKHRAENLNNGGSVTVYSAMRNAARHFWGPAVRNQYLLHYVISGCGNVVGGETYTLHAGSCFLIRPGSARCTPRTAKTRGNTCGRSTASDVLEILRRTGLVNRYVVAVETARNSRAICVR